VYFAAHGYMQWLTFTSGRTSQDKIFGDGVFWSTKAGPGTTWSSAPGITPGHAMQGGPKPAFLRKPVAYYVTGAEQWRYADTLAAVTAESRAYLLDSTGNASDVPTAGALELKAATGKPDHYVYDPHDLAFAGYEAKADPEDLTDQRMIYAQRGKLLVYHTAPFETDTEVSGFFKLSAWIGIDQPDTDFAATLYHDRAHPSAVCALGTTLAIPQRTDRGERSLRRDAPTRIETMGYRTWRFRRTDYNSWANPA